MLNLFKAILFLPKGIYKCLSAYYHWHRTGGKYSTIEVVYERTKTCLSCPIRRGEKCGDGVEVGCGCVLQEKIKLESEFCPVGKW